MLTSSKEPQKHTSRDGYEVTKTYFSSLSDARKKALFSWINSIKISKDDQLSSNKVLRKFDWEPLRKMTHNPSIKHF